MYRPPVCHGIAAVALDFSAAMTLAPSIGNSGGKRWQQAKVEHNGRCLSKYRDAREPRHHGGAAGEDRSQECFHLGTLVEFGGTNEMFMAPQEKRTQDYITGRFG